MNFTLSQFSSSCKPLECLETLYQMSPAKIETDAGGVQAGVCCAETANPLQHLLRILHQARGVSGLLARPLRAVLAQGPGHQETVPTVQNHHTAPGLAESLPVNGVLKSRSASVGEKDECESS